MGRPDRSGGRPAQHPALSVKTPPVRDLRLVFLATISLVAITLASLGSCTRPGDPALDPSLSQDDVTIWVVDNGFHTDLILPRTLLDEGDGPLALAVQSLGPGDWIAVGWGDARFYTDARPISERLPDGARAFFWPGNPSVVLLDPVDGGPVSAPPASSVHAVNLSKEGFGALRGRLESSLRIRGGRAAPGPESQVGDGRFFESTETFWVGHLCNHWAAELLHAGGLPIRPFRTFFSAEIVRMAHSGSETPGAPG